MYCLFLEMHQETIPRVKIAKNTRNLHWESSKQDEKNQKTGVKVVQKNYQDQINLNFNILTDQKKITGQKIYVFFVWSVSRSSTKRK